MKYVESEIVELKKSTSELKEAVISIAAILNKHGHGRLYFGMRDDGTVVGQDIGKSTLRTVSQVIAANIEPRIYPRIFVKRVKDKTCIEVAFDGRQAPYFAHGRAYMRVADEDRQLSARELERLIVSKSRFPYPWETETSYVSLKDVGIRAVRQFVKRANEAGRINYRYDSRRSVLNKLGLMAGGKLLNAGNVLFSRTHMVEVQAAVFAGNDKLTFLDIQSFRGNLFDLIQKSEQYIKEHINWRAEIKGFKREEIPEIPVAAFREAIINSLCHRDFSNPKGNEVAIFKNRIEIYNPGRFPEGHTPAEFIRGKERSLLRNPLIANTFYLASDIERWGSGLKRICDTCRNADVKVEFKNIKTGFLVTFYRMKSGAGTVAARFPEDVTAKVGERVGDKVGENLTANQKRIIKLLTVHPAMSARDLSVRIGISARKIEDNIAKLKTRSLIRRIGPDKGGHWEASSP